MKARDITDAEFEALVIERSHEIPVVIDLWAPWCGPCRSLGPVLEKVAGERPDDFELVKLNVDENPQVASALGARSIPLVVAFRDGAPVSSFVGAQPESAVNQFVDAIQPTQADRKISAAVHEWESGNLDEAERLLRAVIETDKQHENARLMLARLLGESDRYEEALTLLQSMPTSGHDQVSHLMSALRMKMSSGGDVESLRGKVASNPGDIDSMIDLGKALAAGGSYDEALETLLAAIKLDPRYNEGAARRAMLDLFEVMGPDAPQTREYRRKLAGALF